MGKEMKLKVVSIENAKIYDKRTNEVVGELNDFKPPEDWVVTVSPDTLHERLFQALREEIMKKPLRILVESMPYNIEDCPHALYRIDHRAGYGDDCEYYECEHDHWLRCPGTSKCPYYVGANAAMIFR